MLAQEIIDQARAGDEQATNVFVSYCMTAFRGLAGSFAQSTGLEAEDLLQEVAAKMWCKWALILQANTPLSYSRVLARNLMIDHYHRVARQRRQVREVSLQRPIRSGSSYTLEHVLEG